MQVSTLVAADGCNGPAIALVVAGLDKMETILPSVRVLGQRHREYGVQNRHYDVVGAALLWTLEIGLGSGWNLELADAWKTAYTALAGAMIEGAETPAPRRTMTPRMAA